MAPLAGISSGGAASHGDVFPLQPVVDSPVRHGRPRYLAQRCKRARDRAGRLASALGALDSLAEASTGPQKAPHSFANAAQQSVIKRAGRTISALGQPPEGEDREALEALLKTKDFYEFEQLSVVSMDVNKIKALEGRTTPQDLLTRLDGDARHLLEIFGSCIERSQEDLDRCLLAGELAPVQPYWDEGLRRFRKIRRELFASLSAGLV